MSSAVYTLPALSERLDILYVGMLSPHRGGSAIASAQILQGLARRGHRVRAVAPITEERVRAGDTFARHCPEIEATGYLVPYTDGSPETPPSSSYRGLERREVQRLAARLLGERVPDVVVVGRESFAWYVPEILAGGYLPNAVLVQGGTTHGIVNGNYPPALARGLLERLRRIDVAITPARHMADTLRAFGLRSVEVIPNPVDLQRFRPAPPSARLAQALGVRDGDVVVAHLSNLKPLKRALDIVESARAALGRDPRLLYVVVGDGLLRPELERACAERGVADRFRFAGWVDHERVADHLRLADIVVMPSAAEAQALAYLEAQACARTVVASDIPAAREVIDDAQTGLLFRVGDVEDLTRATLRAAADPALRLRIGTAARERVRGHELARVAAAYESTLLMLARRGRTATALGG